MSSLAALRGGVLAPVIAFLDQGAPDRAHKAYSVLRKREPRNVALVFNFANALAAHGFAQQAEVEYRRALDLDPTATDILNNLAAVVGQLGRPAEAVALADAGLARAPQNPPLLTTRAHNRLLQRQFDLAMDDVETLLSIAPQSPEAHNLKGDILGNLSRWPEAIQSFRRAVDLSGSHRQYRVNLGSAYAAAGSHMDAVRLFTEAIRENNRDVKTINALAAVLQRMGKNDDAIRACELILQLDPDHAEARNRIASCLLAMEKWLPAIDVANEVLRRQPGHLEALYNLGMADIGARRYNEAIACFDAILAAGPQDDMALLNLGNALTGDGRVQEALDAYTRMIGRLPAWAGGYLNRGHAYGKQRRWQEALTDYRRAYELEPTRTEHLYSIGNVYLHQGQYTLGWQGYEYRNKSPDGVQRRVPDLAVWSGEDLAGKRLLVFGEQGLGDNVQMARYLPLLQQRGAEISFQGYPMLRALLSTAAPGLKFVDEPKLEDFDYQVATMSLPHKFGTLVDTVPATVPYFVADPERLSKWRERIGTDGFRIGINWQGNPTGKIDEGRSAPLKQFLRFAEVPGVRLISMQKNHGLDQLKDVPEHIKVDLLGDDFDTGKDAFLDTLAVLANLDLVVTTDTSLAHVAGGFGTPVFIALKEQPDWRWMLDRDDSPWYPSARLFRQKAFGAWDDPFVEMTAAIRERVAGRTK